MSTLGDMKHRIAEELRRTTLSGQITNAIKSAIAGYENRRFFFNEYTDTIITTGGTDSVALPDDLLKIDAARLTYGSRPRRLRQVTQGEMSARRDPNVTGVPVEFAVRQQGMALYPVPDAAYSIEIEYVRKLPDLASDADSNAWTVEGEALIRARAKYLVVADLVDTERMAIYAAEETRALSDLNRRSGNYLATGRITPTRF